MIRTNWQNGHDVPICATKVGGNREMKQSGICSRSCRTESKITITSKIFSPLVSFYRKRQVIFQFDNYFLFRNMHDKRW